MRILYLANLRLPTEKAYGIQIAKTCEAFAMLKFKIKNEKLKITDEKRPEENLVVNLIAPTRKNMIRVDFFDYYSIKRNFKFKKIWSLDFYWPGESDKLAVNIKSVISSVFLCFYAITHGADVIYTRDEWPAYFLSFFKRNIIFEAHKFSYTRKFFYGRFKSAGMKVVVISSGLKKDFSAFGFTENKLLLAPDGVDIDKFSLSISQGEAREKVNLPLDKKIVMYTGHLFEWKGANTLLETAIISDKRQETRDKLLFVFVGGTDYDIEKFIQKAEGLNNVLILEHKPYDQIPVLLKAADVLVLPNSAKEEISRKHTSPLKLFEYMASGRPVIASDLASIREVLNDQNAYFFKADDNISLAETIGKVLDNKINAEEKAKLALRDVQQYTWQKRAEKILDFFG